jgi:hypothetical protein
VSTARKANTLLRALLFGLISGAAGVAVGFLIAKTGISMPFVRERLAPLSAWDLLAVPPLVLLVIAVHEAGHLAGGLSRGMRFLLYIVGPFQWSRGSDGGIHFHWAFNLGTFGGVAACLPNPDRPLAVQMQPMILGGPLASLLLALLGVVAAIALEGRPAGYCLITAALSAAIFMATAMPMRSGGFMSDGAQWLEVRRGGAAVAERQRLTVLMAQSAGGSRPAKLDAALIEDALRSEDGEPLRRVAARYFALLHAWDGGDLARASDCADWLGAHLEDYPQGFRQAIAVELALFALLGRDDADAARAWLTRARGGVVDPTRRALADAALARSEGRSSDALDALERARRQLGRGSDAGLAHFSRDQIDALAKRLDAPSVAA